MKPVYATVSSKGQLVIPAEMRAALGIESGTRVLLQIEDARVIVEPLTMAARLHAVNSLRGICAGLGGSMCDDLLEERRREHARELAREDL